MGPFNTAAIGLLYSYRNKFPHSSPEAPRIIQMRETSTSEGGNYYQIYGNLLEFFTCRKAGTWGRFFYFPSEGRHTEDFSGHPKNPTASAMLEPANSGSSSQYANH